MLGLIAIVLETQGPIPARVEITPANAEIKVGDTLRLRARVLDAVGSEVPGFMIRWFSARGQGSVDSTGLVRAGYVGDILVTAMAQRAGAQALIGQIAIHVGPLPPATVVITPAVTRIALGSHLSLSAKAFSAQGDARFDPIVFGSGNPKVLGVAADGRIHGLAAGSATVTARAGPAMGSLTVQVVDLGVVIVEIVPVGRTVRTGDVIHFSARATDKAGKVQNDLRARWGLIGGAPGAVAQIDGDGVFVAETPGVYTVVGEVAGREGETTIAVTPRRVGRGIEVVGRLPIPFNGAEVWVHPSGGCAYFSTQADRLYAIDITTPSRPTIVDSIMIDARVINDVMTTEDGRYGVFSREGNSARKNGIAIFDAAIPCHPKMIADYTETVSGGVHSAYVYQGHVYLTDDATGSLRVIDIRDPYHPREVARWQTDQTQEGRYLHDVAVTDGLAYLSYWNDGLVILDIGNGIKGGRPDHPVKVSQLKYDLNALYARVDQLYGLGARGTHTAWRAKNYVFIADEVYARRTSTGLEAGNDLTWGRLQVVDVSNLESPKIVAWYEPTDGGVHNVWVEGDSLYLGNYQGGGRVVDISGELKGDLLRQGREITWLPTSDDKGVKPRATFTWGAVVKNGLIFFNDLNTGLWIARMEPTQRAVP